MNRFWRALVDALGDLGATGIVEILIAGFALSLCLSGLYFLCRRKIADTLPLLVALTFVGCVVSMAMALGFVHRTRGMDRASQGPFNGEVFVGVAPSDWSQPPVKPSNHGEKNVSRSPSSSSPPFETQRESVELQ
jgi:hypothetical protein